MNGRIIRLRNDWLRVGLLLALFLPNMVGYILRALMPVRWGGHPNKRRLLCADFYTMPLDLYVAAMRGFFVGMK